MKHAFFNHPEVKHLLTMSVRIIFVLFVCFIVASLVDRVFPEVDIQQHPLITFAEITIHLIVLLIIVYFIRRLIYMIPFPPHSKSIMTDKSIDSFDVEVIINIILIGTQQRLLRKFDVIGKHIFGITEIVDGDDDKTT
jgi:hypothetical protein